MPHSSGGGSSSGGSHSGGGSGSSGGYGRGPWGSGGYVPSYRRSIWYFPGARKFVRYGHGTPDFYYTDEPDFTLGTVISLLIALVFIISGLRMVIASSHFGTVTMVDPNASWVMISDRQGSFSADEKREIEGQIWQYYKKTGIRTRIETVSPKAVKAANKDSLYNYAYWRYVNLWEDENHWLIVFEDAKDGSTWRFEGVQGDNTDRRLTKKIADKFNSNLTSSLWASSRYTYGGAFVHALTQLNSDSSHLQLDVNFIFGWIIILQVVWIFLPLFKKKTVSSQMREKGYREIHFKVKMDEGDVEPKTVTCPYCGGIYVLGERKCPHCGAPAERSNTS